MKRERKSDAEQQTLEYGRDWIEAWLLRNEGLSYEPDEDGKLHFTIEQAKHATCLTRKDVGIVLYLQKVQLKRLNSIYRLAWVAVALLAFIAVRLL